MGLKPHFGKAKLKSYKAINYMIELRVYPDQLASHWASRIPKSINPSKDAYWIVEHQKAICLLTWLSIVTCMGSIYLAFIGPISLRPLAVLTIASFAVLSTFCLDDWNKRIVYKSRCDGFMKDLEALSLNLSLNYGQLAAMSMGEIAILASDCLRQLAMELQRVQNTMILSEHAELIRNAFRAKHTLFLSFGLVQPKWDGYFSDKPDVTMAAPPA